MTDAERVANGRIREPRAPLAVFRNRAIPAALAGPGVTQIGGNMVMFGLTVIIFEADAVNTAVSVLLLTFLVPAVLFSAVAGVYVDRLDRRMILDRDEPPAGGAFG